MDTPINNSGFGQSNASDSGMSSSSRGTSSSSGVCEHCGQPLNRGLEQFLGKLGVSDDAINNIKNQLQNVDVEEYLNKARDYVKDSKATQYAKDNPGKVAAGVAVLAVGAGLLISALNRD
ncbi:MAG TPA: hypothetical protein VJ853_03825 [Thermoanaerobaculia bacterium]|nr:hypothetical protein [Thermoanaerobaculia bacterium]